MSRRMDIRTMHRHGLKQAQQRFRRVRARFRVRIPIRQRMRGGPQLIMPVVRRGNGRVFSIEKKFHDLDIDDTAIANTGTIVTPSANLIAQGTDETERVGRKVTITNIHWKFEVRLPTQTAGSTASDVARIILYLDKQANGAAATVTGILESANYQSFNNLANKSRFRTLMDRTYNLNAQAGGGDGTTEDYGQVILSDELHKKVNITVEFDAGVGVITELRSNNIGVLTISRSGVAAFASKMRLRYTDL